MDSQGRSSATAASPEESSWTMYFEDFSNNNKNIDIDNDNDDDDMNENSSFFSDINYYQTSSLVSDAASSAAVAASARSRHVLGGSSNSDKICKRLSFKRRKTKGTATAAAGGGSFVDDDLEDTASSPAHSPKVCELVNHFDKNIMKQKHAMDISQEKGSASAGKKNETNIEEMGFIGRPETDDATELKKRGLCLVPLSMVAHYLG